MLQLTVNATDLPFLVYIGTTYSTINIPMPPELLSDKMVNLVGFSGVMQNLPITKSLQVQVAIQTLLHPFICSPNGPVNLLVRDLLIKVGASNLCFTHWTGHLLS